ncbi:MAG: C40 family peptidase [Lachnospiraceae bacterium]|nr:C40 family peptidase [Lachnospiraceae bacterium]
MKKKLNPLTIAVSMLTVLVTLAQGWRAFYVYADPTIDELKEQRDQDQDELDEINATLEELADEQAEIEDQIAELTDALTEVLGEIELLEEEIGQKEFEIEDAREELQEAEDKEVAQYEAMKVRICYMYEQGEASYASMLMEAGSYSDLLTKADYIEELYSYDRKMLAEYQDTVQEVSDKKAALEQQMAEMEEIQAEYEAEKENMEEVIAELKLVSDDYAADIRVAQNQASEYRERIKSQNAEIARLEEEERTRKEEEERRRREEEERKRREEEARKAAEQAAQNAQNGEATTVTTTKQSTFDISSIYAAAGGDTGKAIAAFACQFIGNPYVAGGTSLTNGADCSGFVFSVYREFGYKVPRTSYTLRTAGREVSYAEAQPGDVVCYPGHVAIYIGNGMIVHASTEKTGIKVSRMNYRNWLTIRRIV